MAPGLGTLPISTEALLVAALIVASVAVVLRATVVIALPGRRLVMARPGMGAVLGRRSAVMVPFSRAVRAVATSGSVGDVTVVATAQDGTRVALVVGASWTLLDARAARLEPEEAVRRAVANAVRWWLRRRPTVGADEVVVVDRRAHELAVGVAELSGVRLDHLWVRDWTVLPAAAEAAR